MEQLARSKVAMVLVRILMFVVMIAIIAGLIYVIPKLETFYEWVSDNVPILGRFIDWARNLTGV